MARYVEALHALAVRLEGRTVVLSAAHNDLTMANVLVAGSGVGVVDWESASATAPPLADLWYALADGVSRAGGITHAQAVAALARRHAPIPAALAAAPEDHARACPHGRRGAARVPCLLAATRRQRARPRHKRRSVSSGGPERSYGAAAVARHPGSRSAMRGLMMAR